MSIIEVKGLSFEYIDSPVLEDISFTVEKGETLGIIGSNGAGKSTLMKLLLGILPCRRGEITILGQDRSRCDYIKGIGYVSQKANSFNTSFPATVEEVVEANLYSKIGFLHRPKRSDRERCREIIKYMGLEEYSSRLMGHLSGGQQQRVFIARALAAEPELLFMDEPTVGVDTLSVEVINEVIRRLHESGMTMVMTNHDTADLIALSDKLLILSGSGGGEVVKRGELSRARLKSLMHGIY